MKTQLDLHGYHVAEAVDAFVKHYNTKVRNGDFSPISVIHGYGSSGKGARIKTAMKKFFAANEGCFTLGESSWNPGETTVYPGKALPEGAGIVSAGILEYCRIPRTESKILGKYRQHGDLRVKKTLRLLVKQKSLSVSLKGRHTLYTAV